MILEEQLKIIIEDQLFNKNTKDFVKRTVDISETGNRVMVVSGVRRCGKSTLLLQNVSKNDNTLVINFEDPRLESFELNDFYKLENIANKSNKNIFVFDEIQNIPEWEKYVRSANERGKKIYITGSNASLLSKELGTRLTGRYKQTELFPFNFAEYLEFTSKNADENSYKDFLISGGFPEYLKEQNPEYLRTLLKDIIIRDIAVRRNIRNENLVVRLAVYLISNIGKELSYNNITKILQIKSVRSTIDYCDYLQESYLFEFVPLFSYSIKQQIGNPKKVYCIDTGMAKANSLSMSDDFGRMLENAVYIKLRNKTKDIQYFKNENSECDFIVEDNNKKLTAIQVCWNLTIDNLKRELEGLKNAIEITKAEKGLIITYNQEDNFENIPVIPVWKWNY